MKNLILCFALFSLLAKTAKSEEEPSFRFHQPLEGELREKSMGRVSLGREVFADTLTSFRDLRLVHDGREIPYLVQPREIPRAAPEEKIPTKILDFEETEQGSLVTTIQLDSEQEASQIRFRTALRDFEKNVRVEGSLDRESWSLLVGEALLFDYSRFFDFRKSEVELPENSFRYFRITIEGATDRQRSLVSTLTRQVSESSGVAVETQQTVTKREFRVDEISFYTKKREKGENDSSSERYDLEFFEEVAADEPNLSRFEIQTDRLPLGALLVETEEVNFRRKVEVQVPVAKGEEGWRTVQSSEIFRYELGEFQSERLRIELPEAVSAQRPEKMRLVIRQGDNLPVFPTKMEGEVRIHDLYFVSPGSGELRLAFGAGGNEIELPSYDTAAIRMGLRRKMAFTEFEAGEVVENPGFSVVEKPIQWAEQQWILWLIIGLVVAFLTWILFGSAREMEKANIE
ncbi:MAG: DUF3999 family protein [Verrucomicrobiota bacterium]